MQITRRLRLRAVSWLLPGLCLVLAAAACQPSPPTGPTSIPTASRTMTPSPTPSSIYSPTPLPTLRQMFTATEATILVPVVAPPTAGPTPGPYCYDARAGDTLCGLIFRAGYAECSRNLLIEFRSVNGMAANDNNILNGKRYCVPRQTPTPTPPGYELTQTARPPELRLPTGVGPVATYVPVAGDTVSGLRIALGITLRELCTLNPPDVINCAGCDLSQEPGKEGCRPIIVVGKPLSIPGPTLTPSVTPTLTGSETPTPTPRHTEPVILGPTNGETVAGVPLLIWIGTRLLEPDEFYLVLWSDATLSRTLQHETHSNSFRLPAELQPADGAPHTVNWRVGVAKLVDGNIVFVSPMSRIYTFIWQSR